MDSTCLLKEKAVDVIITDINMPKMDGYGVIQNVRANSDYDSTPILVLTTESDRKRKSVRVSWVPPDLS